jgi:ketosteroid isomerase-like protein
MTTRVPAEVAAAYFRAINGRDENAIRNLFAPDAVLITPAGRMVGPAAITAFYATQVFPASDLEARPGPLLIADTQVAVEIQLRMQGQPTRVADFFEVRGGLIQRLSVYLGGPSEVG